MNELRKFRLKMGWTQATMAKELGLSLRQVQNLEITEKLRKIVLLALQTIRERHSP